MIVSKPGILARHELVLLPHLGHLAGVSAHVEVSVVLADAAPHRLRLLLQPLGHVHLLLLQNDHVLKGYSIQ